MTDLAIDVGDARVAALLCLPPEPFAGLVLAHGAGAGMRHAFMAALAEGLAGQGVATLRYQFPYMEAGGKRPDRPPLAQAAVRAAVAQAATSLPGVPLFAGGKSFGGRMTSQAQAEAPLPGVRGLVFFGFPLHAAGKPATTRAAHLTAMDVPMLFVQGTRDALAERDKLGSVLGDLGPRATLVCVEDGDHSFHVRVGSGRTDTEALDVALAEAVTWMRSVLASARRS